MRLSKEGDWFLEVEVVGSTQEVAGQILSAGDKGASVVFAHHQTRGRGRFDREWLSQRGESLTMSILFREYADHPQPWLIGMSVACAAAGALQCQLRWPNDIVSMGKKLGGVLTDLLPDASDRKTPVVGLGINLNQTQFPRELEDVATSLRLVYQNLASVHGEESAEDGVRFDPKQIAMRIVDRIVAMPEAGSWDSLAPIWGIYDATEGKHYKLPDGRTAIAIGLGPNGELRCMIDGEPAIVMAADALFGVVSQS